jgi:hypothetical protein
MSDTAPSAVVADSRYPTRSKMLDVYAADIALLLTERRVDDAERHALSIPHIAIALADAGLQSSLEAYRDWCIRWVQPDFGAATYDEWCTRSGECYRSENDLPFAALRVLRLSRRAREVHAPIASSEPTSDTNEARTVVYALLGAHARWYEQQGRYLPAVQTNLARLGVLR